MRCHGTFVLLAELHHTLNQGGVGRGERVAVEAQVVLETGSGMATGVDAPLIEHNLVRPDARAAPLGVGCQTLQGLDVEVKTGLSTGIAFFTPMTNWT